MFRSRSTFPLSLVLTIACASAGIAAPPGEDAAKKIPQHFTTAIADWPADGALKLAGPLASFSKVWLTSDPKHSPLEFGFNPTATEITIYLPATPSEKDQKPSLTFLTVEETVIHPDGTVILSALDSEVVGTNAKLETHPGNHRIGFWGKAEDFVRWDATIPAGEYEVELAYSRASKTGTEVSISFGDTALPHKLETTGSWYRYRVVPLGAVTIKKGDQTRVETRVTKIINGGVMNLKALILTPKSK